MPAVPERSRSPEGPRHLAQGTPRLAARPRHAAPGSELLPWWRALDARRLWVAIGATFLALPLLVLDNLPESSRDTAEAVETVAPTTESSTTATTEATTSTTEAPTTTVGPTTTAPPTTEAPTTAPPAAVRTVAPPSTRPAPPPTAPPTTTAPPAPGSVEAIIHAHFGAAGGDAVVIARCESGLNPSAIGGGGRYFGLFQLGRDHAAPFEAVTGRVFDEAWSDANANAQYAAWLYSRSGWSPWGCRDQV